MSQYRVSRKSVGTSMKTVANAGYTSPSQEEYQELRLRANSLIRQRIRRRSTEGQGSSAKSEENWKYFLESVLRDGNNAVQVLLRQETPSYQPVVNSIVETMIERLLSVGRNMIDICKVNDRPNLEKVSKYWNDDVGDYLVAMFTWTEVEIVKILHSKGLNQAFKSKHVKDIFDVVEDLLHGIYT